MQNSSSPSGNSCSQHKPKAAAYSKVCCSHCRYVYNYISLQASRCLVVCSGVKLVCAVRNPCYCSQHLLPVNVARSTSCVYLSILFAAAPVVSHQAYTHVLNACLMFLQELAHAVGQQSQQLAALAQQLLLGLLQSQQQQQQQQLLQDVPASTVALLASLCDRHRMAVSSLMMATAPFSLPGECHAAATAVF